MYSEYLYMFFSVNNNKTNIKRTLLEAKLEISQTKLSNQSRFHIKFNENIEGHLLFLNHTFYSNTLFISFKLIFNFYLLNEY